MKRAGFVLVILCLALILTTNVTFAAAKKPTTQFPAGAKITVTNLPPFFWVFAWTAATGTFDSYRLDLVKASAKAVSVSADTARTTKYTCETVHGEGYPHVSPGDHTVRVSACPVASGMLTPSHPRRPRPTSGV